MEQIIYSDYRTLAAQRSKVLGVLSDCRDRSGSPVSAKELDWIAHRTSSGTSRTDILKMNGQYNQEQAPRNGHRR